MLPFTRGLTSYIHLGYCANTKNHTNMIICTDRAEWLCQIQDTIPHLHMWWSIWLPPHSVNTGVKKRPHSPLKIPWCRQNAILQYFLKSISKITGPILLGLFVLIWMPFFKVNPNIAMKIWTWVLFEKKLKCHLQSTVWRGLVQWSINIIPHQEWTWCHTHLYMYTRM